MKYVTPGRALLAAAAIAMFPARPAFARGDAPAQSAAAANPSSAPVIIQHAPSIDITGATYGLRRTRLVCQAMAAVKRQCQGRGQCRVPAADTECPPGGQAPSVLIATLSVQFHCYPGDKLRTASADRPFELHISCLGIAR